jgi:hypothetical protein
MARPPAPERPAPTVPDEAPAEAIGRVLQRSGGAPLLVRLVIDGARIAAATAVMALAWGKLAPQLTSSVLAGFPETAHGFALGAILFLATAALSMLLFRVTSRRFVRPLRGQK